MAGQSGMEQADLQALERLYGLLHRGQPLADLDVTSRDLLMRMLDDTTQQTLARVMSGPLMSPGLERRLTIEPDRRARGEAVAEAAPRLRSAASPRPSLHTGESSRRLELQGSMGSRDGRRDGLRAGGEHRLARVASNRSSTTVMPYHHRSAEHSVARLGWHGSSRAATPRHETVTALRRDGRGGHGPRRRSSGRGEQSSLEYNSSSRSRRHSHSREPSAAHGRASLHRRGASFRHGGAEEGSSARRRSGRRIDSGLSVARMASRRGPPERAGRGVATTKRSSSSDARARLHRRGASSRHGGAEEGSSTRRRSGRRPDSGLSVARMTSRRGAPERAGRGVATAKRSSSSDADATIRSRIRPNRDPRERRSFRRAGDHEAEGETSPRPTKEVAVAASVRKGRPRRALNRIDSGSTYSSSSSWTSGASGSSSSTSPSPRRHSARSRSRSRRRRQERRQRRDKRLSKLKDKFSVLFHHHSGGERSGRGCVSWRGLLGAVFHHRSAKTASRTVGGAVSRMQRSRERARGFLDLLGRVRDAQRTRARMRRMKRVGSRVRVKKLHWWQRLKRRRRSNKLFCRVGRGKKV